MKITNKRNIVEALRLPQNADKLGALGLQYEHEGKFSEAEACLKMAAELQYAEGEFFQDVETLLRLNDLACFYRRTGQPDKAATIREILMLAGEVLCGTEAVEMVVFAQGLASVYKDLFRYAEAEPLYERAQAGWIRLFGKDFPEVSGILHDRAEMALAQGQAEEAIQLGKKALAVWKRALTANHPAVADELDFLASVYQKMGVMDQVSSCAKRARAIRVKACKGALTDDNEQKGVRGCLCPKTTNGRAYSGCVIQTDNGWIAPSSEDCE